MVEIRAHEIDDKPAVVPTLVTVEEGTPWKWNLGLGYAAGERLGVDARISHLNVFGTAGRVDLQGHVSRIERTVEATYTQADTWHPALAFALQGRHHAVDESAFSVLSRGGEGFASWQWAPQFASTFSYAVALERSEVDPALDPLLGLQDGMLNAWAADLVHRHVTRLQAPNSILSLHVEQAGRWMPGTFNYFSIAGDARHYRSASDNSVVFATRLRMASSDPVGGEEDLPLLKRFFLGGSNEMRGWGVYELSPLSASGEPVGGKSLLSAIAELRVPVFKRVRGAIFVEAGNVWQDSLVRAPRRSALRHRLRCAPRDTVWPPSSGSRLSAHASRRTAHRWPAADESLAVQLRDWGGILMPERISTRRYEATVSGHK